MAKSQYELCVEVLRRLDKAGVLQDVILIGSWCMLFYRDFFGRGRYVAPLKTRGMDLLIPKPSAVKAEVDVAGLLKDLGFVVGFTGSKGYIRLPHPARFALHKLVVLSRRADPAKQAKDKEAAIRVLEALIDAGREDSIRNSFAKMPRRWQGVVRKQLADPLDKKVMDVLSQANSGDSPV